MAITSISITQDNIVEDSNLIPIHSPVMFIADVLYTGLVPDTINVQILNESDTLLQTYKCIPYRDLLTGIRQFIFIASEPIRSLMEDFADFAQLVETLVAVPDITKIFKLKFVDPDNSAIFDVETFTFAHAIKQFGENPNLNEQYNNEDDHYFAAKNTPVYLYFYNNDSANVVNVNSDLLTLIPDVLNIIEAGSTEVINVLSNGSWIATESETWFALTTPSGSGDGSFGVVVDANASGLLRSSTITVTRGTIVKYVTVNQATSVLTATCEFNTPLTVDTDTSVEYEAWRNIEILPTSRNGNSINIVIDYYLNIEASGVGNARFFYKIGDNPTTPPTGFWTLIDSVSVGVLGGNESETDTATIEVADGEYLFIKTELNLSGGVFDSSTVNLDLENGSVVIPGTGTVTATGLVDWDKTIIGGA